MIGRDDGSLYNQTWIATIRNQPQWVYIVTFNDWNEGTIIEPSVQFGYKYLYATAYFAAKFKNQAVDPNGIPVSYAIYNATLTVRQAEQSGRTAGLDESEAKAQAAENAFDAKQYADAIGLAKQSTQLALQATIPQILTTSSENSSTSTTPLQSALPPSGNTTYVVGAIGVVTVVAIAIMIMRRRPTPRSKQTTPAVL